jgi:hypothetical protein
MDTETNTHVVHFHCVLILGLVQLQAELYELVMVLRLHYRTNFDPYLLVLRPLTQMLDRVLGRIQSIEDS